MEVILRKNKLLRFVDFVNKYVGDNYATIAEYFESEISQMAIDCRVNWAETKNNLKYDGIKDNSKNITNLSASDKRRTYVSGIIKEFEKDGNTFEYPIIIFACMQNSYGRPAAKFNALGLLFDAYDKYKNKRIIPSPSKKISTEQLQHQEKKQLEKDAKYQAWVDSQKAKEPKLFANMLSLSAGKGFSTYLQDKKVSDVAKLFDIRVGKDNNGYFTCFQLSNIQGEVGGLQRIYHKKPNEWESNKKQTIGFDPIGSFLILGPLSSKSEMIYICEGLSTGLSMYKATGRTVIVCLMSQNIVPVSKIINNKLPNVKRVHVADNDKLKVFFGNTGVTQCSLSVNKNGGYVFIPKPSMGSDANDVHLYDGLEELKKQIHNCDNYLTVSFAKNVAGNFNFLN